MIDGFGIPVASQARVVWTFTVTVTLVGPGAIDGGTKKQNNKQKNNNKSEAYPTHGKVFLMTWNLSLVTCYMTKPRQCHKLHSGDITHTKEAAWVLSCSQCRGICLLSL